MYKVLIIEDDYSYALEIKFMVENYGYKVVGIESQADKIKHTLKSTSVDLILSDVKLGENSFSFNYLSSIDNLPPVILFSSYDEEELFEKSMEINPVVYIKKPIEEVTLISAMANAIRNASVKPSRYKEISSRGSKVFIKCKGEMVPIDPSEIRFIKSEGNHCEIMVLNQKYVIRSSIRNILNLLDTDILIQVHRAYIINLKMIKSFSISNDEVHIDGNVTIPVGRTYKKNLKAMLD